MNKKINDIHLDMLAEIFNMGMGQAVSAISKLSGEKHEVRFELPSVDIITKEEFLSSLSEKRDLGIIQQTYRGDFSGKSYMYYPSVSGREFAKLLIGTEMPSDQIEKLESDALVEIGNIFINASIVGLADFLNKEIKTDLPQLVFSNFIDLESEGRGDWVVRLNSSFIIDHLNIEGKIAFVLQNESIDLLLDAIDAYIEELS